MQQVDELQLANLADLILLAGTLAVSPGSGVLRSSCLCSSPSLGCGMPYLF